MNLLLLGESKTGKTVFMAQLYERATSVPDAALRLKTTPGQMKVVEEALQRLLQGKAPEHTRTGTTGTIVLPLLGVNGREVDLVWPEYAGETFLKVLRERHLTPTWRDRILAANGILLMIRPHLKRGPRDVLEAPRRAEGDAPRAADEEDDEDQPLAPDAQFVELLQLLSFARGDGRLHRSTIPMTVVLSCWDELRQDNAEVTVPAAELAKHYPLLAAYLKGAWAPEEVTILGLSAWGGPFSEDLGSRFAELGPAGRGYMIDEQGQEHLDLTRVLTRLIEMAYARST